uniref:PAS domain-containing protein n=1 Tax=Haptolina ericina TaxID=156174 RepID=A0A7S3AXH0_9EUKA
MTYVTPETAGLETKPSGVAALWTTPRGGVQAENQACKKQKTGEETPQKTGEEVLSEEVEEIATPDVPPVPPTLTALQHRVLERLVGALDTRSCSVVVTNPHVRDNPIVYVTEPWQHMCGFSAREAIGRNPRLTQGQRSDASAMRSISSALREQRACKVMMLNYRGGLADQPFWNMLSINPVHHEGQLMLYMAHLQDYSYEIGRMVSLTPSQFCRSGEVHQRQRHLSQIRPGLLAKPTVYEAADEVQLTRPMRSSGSAPLVKRLGWDRLKYDPEHLVDRVVDTLQQLDAQIELSEHSGPDGETFSIHARVNDVACRIVVNEDLAEGSYRLSCVRVSGDTFAYHAVFRQMRDLLSDDNFASARL